MSKKWFSVVAIVISFSAVLYKINLHKFQDFIVRYVEPNNNLKIHSKAGESNMNEMLFEGRELLQYNGGENSKGLYLSILGSIYNVEKGSKHYGPQGSYNVFAGRDASKAFITGDFELENDDMDGVLSLTNRDLIALSDWKKFYEKEYPYMGKLIGRFYDAKGHETEYLFEVEHRVEIARLKKAEEESERIRYPSCNVEWNEETGSRVWCSDKSGGVERDWVGVPRKLYEPGKTEHRCTCVKEPDNLPASFEEYNNCDSQSPSCYVKFN